MKLKYNANERKIYIQSKNEIDKVIEDRSPTKPIISPNGEKAIYISPFEWELIGKIYSINLDTFEIELLFNPQNNLTTKDITWINNNEIAIILGYPYGTTALGGDVYKYNIINHKLKLLSKYSSKIQITKIKYEDKQLLLEGIRYIDENYMEKQEYYEKLRI